MRKSPNQIEKKSFLLTSSFPDTSINCMEKKTHETKQTKKNTASQFNPKASRPNLNATKTWLPHQDKDTPGVFN